jgi:5-methylcytosine-specific restriction protein B
MKLALIQESLQAFKSYLTTDQASDQAYLYETQQNFHHNWNLEAQDLASMYERSLTNQKTNRLWNRENYEPKRMMTLFAETQPDFVRQMFQHLYDEQLKVEGRAGRFVFYCDELLTDYREQHLKSKEDSHFHQDGYEMVFLYLALKYPEQYSFYNFTRFQSMLKAIGAPEIPLTHDLERFVKVSRTLYNVLRKDVEIWTLHLARLPDEGYYRGESLLLVYEWMGMHV